MISVRRDPVSALEGVSENAALRTGARHGDEIRMRASAEEIGEHSLRHARLDHGDARVGIEIADSCACRQVEDHAAIARRQRDRKSTRLNSSHLGISYAVFCLKKKKQKYTRDQ